MRKTEKSLTDVLGQRLTMAGLYAQQLANEASEVIVFGSMAVGLHRPDSDVDVLCVGGADYKLHTALLDLIVVPQQSTDDPIWLQSELASHVGKYGKWIKGSPRWRDNARVTSKVVDEKRRRISAFMRSLPGSWPRLRECFRAKYATKLRRETQRLILLEHGVPVPPTRVLDYSWSAVSHSVSEVSARLRRFAPDEWESFTDDLLARVDAHLRANNKNNYLETV
jgi:predicted nucleotidyltransferase